VRTCPSCEKTLHPRQFMTMCGECDRYFHVDIHGRDTGCGGMMDTRKGKAYVCSGCQKVLRAELARLVGEGPA
jgi:hypothetical protein